jgi:hypothetical protein
MASASAEVSDWPPVVIVGLILLSLTQFTILLQNLLRAAKKFHLKRIRELFQQNLSFEMNATKTRQRFLARTKPFEIGDQNGLGTLPVRGGTSCSRGKMCSHLVKKKEQNNGREKNKKRIQDARAQTQANSSFDFTNTKKIFHEIHLKFSNIT